MSLRAVAGTREARVGIYPKKKAWENAKILVHDYYDEVPMEILGCPVICCFRESPRL
jgi:hypothetical protein